MTVSDNHSQRISPPAAVFQLSGVAKRWPGAQGFELTVPGLTIRRGEMVALVGFSGCGKSTLLDLLAMVLRPDRMEAFTFQGDGRHRLDVARAWRNNQQDRLARVRMRAIGYVLQTGGLLPFLSVAENIGLSRMGLGLPVQGAGQRLAERLGIARHMKKYPGQLSVGERQRVAIARAMAHEPAVVIADEPTASLDPINAQEIMALFTHIARDNGVTLVMATHDKDRAEAMGFRCVTFDLNQNDTDGTVCASVSEQPVRPCTS